MSPKPSSTQETVVTARPGDDVLKLAARAGVPWRRIWNHPGNQELARRRGSPSILEPGDRLVVPRPERRSEAAPSERRHRFRAMREWAWIRVKIFAFGRRRAREPYHVLAAGRKFEGTRPETDDEGLVECRIPADVDTATVVLGEKAEETHYELLLGHIDPIDTPRGKHGRLQNLGYYDGAADAPYGVETRQALARFLADRGEPDPDTSNPDDEKIRRKLEQDYGS